MDYQKWSSLGSELTTYWWDIIKIIISVSKEKVQFTLFFYLKQNEVYNLIYNILKEWKILKS